MAAWRFALGPAAAALACLAPALASNADLGRALFRQQCLLCHSAEPADHGGSDGPGLGGLLGRSAAGDPDFSYTQALRSAKIVWDAPTLERFLASPGTLVPGTAMTAAVPDAQDRRALLSYLESLSNRTPAGRPASSVPTARIGGRHGDLSAQAHADWRFDAPGRLHWIDIEHLPPPYLTAAARNPPQLVEEPASAALRLPHGFRIGVFARGLAGPRALRVAPSGEVFVSETRAGRITVLQPAGDGAVVATKTVFAQGLSGPFGMAFYPRGDHPQWLYVAEVNRVVRYRYQPGDQVARAAPEIVIPSLAPASTYGHSTRDLAISADGAHLYVSVGSASNVAEDMPRKTPAQIQAWEASRAAGAAWGAEENRADVLEFDIRAPGPARILATGLRNCVGLSIQAQTGQLWCTTNERDLLGDDLVPDYSTRVRDGAFYGWPWYYTGGHEDPRHRGERPDLAGKVTLPDVPFQAHSAPLSLVFYDATAGSSVFPRDYLGDGFAVMHGSWNRASRTGYKVVRVRMAHGAPTGEYEDFLVGFIIDDARVRGRPVGAAVSRDGSLLISDDGANVVYRISYAP